MNISPTIWLGGNSFALLFPIVDLTFRQMFGLVRAGSSIPRQQLGRAICQFGCRELVEPSLFPDQGERDPAGSDNAPSERDADSRKDTGGVVDGTGADVVGPAGEVPFHPLAILPMLDEASQLAMARDIRERGQFEAIVLYQKQIFDGRCRYRACLLAEATPKFEEYQGDDPLGYMFSRNIHRRHLLKDSQRALVAARLASLPVGANGYSKEGVSIDAACKLLRVTPTAVNRAKKILRRGIPDVVKAVEDGSLTLWKALLLAKVRNSEQQAEMDRLAASESPVVEASNSPNLPTATEPSEAQVETSDSDNATGAAEVDAPAAEQPKAGPEVSCSSPSSASLPSTPTESWRRIQ